MSDEATRRPLSFLMTHQRAQKRGESVRLCFVNEHVPPDRMTSWPDLSQGRGVQDKDALGSDKV